MTNPNPTVLSTDLFDPQGIAVDANFIYLTNGDGVNTITRMNKNGSNKNNNFITGLNTPLKIAVDDSHIYVTNINNTLRIIDKNGSNPNHTVISNIPQTLAIVVDVSYIYVSSGNTIRRMDKNGSNQINNFITGLNSPQGIAIDDNYIYVTNYNIGTISRIDKNGSNPNHSFITGLNFPQGIAVDDIYIYVISSNKVIKIEKNNGSNPKEIYVTGLVGLKSVAIYEGIIYINNYPNSLTSFTENIIPPVPPVAVPEPLFVVKHIGTEFTFENKNNNNNILSINFSSISITNGNASSLLGTNGLSISDGTNIASLSPAGLSVSSVFGVPTTLQTGQLKPSTLIDTVNSTPGLANQVLSSTGTGTKWTTLTTPILSSVIGAGNSAGNLSINNISSLHFARTTGATTTAVISTTDGANLLTGPLKPSTILDTFASTPGTANQILSSTGTGTKWTTMTTPTLSSVIGAGNSAGNLSINNISSLSFSSGGLPALQISSSNGGGTTPSSVLTMNTMEDTTSERVFQNKYVEIKINGTNYWIQLYS